jgi:DNA invertase Pin-like site-specific DNA recombinase
LTNTESTQRQYALRDEAVALGWPIERVHTIDEDLGRSGARAQDRDGFQYLVSEVALGHAGIVLGLEVSRLARSNADWQRLLELCALADCLIADEEGVYDPAHFNDRLLLGLKGTMSEAELHVLKARLHGGKRNKAARGALAVSLPIGLVFNAAGAVVLDPDVRIQATFRLIFDTFRQTASVSAVADRLRRDGCLFPRRIRSGPRRGQVIFGPVDASRIPDILRNPRYAGAYVYGRTRTAPTPFSKRNVIALAPEQWPVLIPNAHPGYLSWEAFESNQQILQNILTQYQRTHLRGRQASEALLQGRVLCGTCGTRMWVRDSLLHGQRVSYYYCHDRAAERPGKPCRWIRAGEIDAAICVLLPQAVTAARLASAVAVQDELTQRLEQAQAARRRELQQARHGAELKRRRFLNCDPDHRLVADALEGDWNEALRRLDALQQKQKLQPHAEQGPWDEKTRARLSSLADHLPRIWNDPRTAPRERQRMLGLLVEDVTLIEGDPIAVQVRFRGGRTTSLTVPHPRPAARVCQVAPELIRELDQFLQSASDAEAAARLNTLGYRNWHGQPFTALGVTHLRQRAGLKTRFERLRAQGFLTAREIAAQLGIYVGYAYQLGRAGVLSTQHYGRGRRCLFAPPDGTLVIHGRSGAHHSRRLRLTAVQTPSHPTKRPRR